MSGEEQNSSEPFKKAEDLKVIFNFEIDNSPESIQRTQQVKEIITQMLMLARKKGRPSRREEEENGIAA